MTRSIHERAAALAVLMQGTMGIRGRDFEAKVRRAGRSLPRHLRREADVIIQAAKLEENPRLARQIDLARVDRAERLITQHLDSIDPFQRRFYKAVDFVAANAFVVLVTLGLVISVAVWRGLV